MINHFPRVKLIQWSNHSKITVFQLQRFRFFIFRKAFYVTQLITICTFTPYAIFETPGVVELHSLPVLFHVCSTSIYAELHHVSENPQMASALVMKYGKRL